MKILFSVYKEEFETSETDFIDSVWVQTDWSAEKINQYLGMHEGYRSEIVIGEQLSFIDYYCFFDNTDTLLKKIKSIPSCNDDVRCIRFPYVFRVRQTDAGAVDLPDYLHNKNSYIYALDHYECGASGFAAIVLWAASHPIEMVFIGGVLYDFSKWTISKVMMLLGMKHSSIAIRPIILNTKKLYRNFSKTTNINIRDCQITKINRLKTGVFHVKIYTGAGKRFKLRCYANGKIDMMEEITNV